MSQKIRSFEEMKETYSIHINEERYESVVRQMKADPELSEKEAVDNAFFEICDRKHRIKGERAKAKADKEWAETPTIKKVGIFVGNAVAGVLGVVVMAGLVVAFGALLAIGINIVSGD